MSGLKSFCETDHLLMQKPIPIPTQESEFLPVVTRMHFEYCFVSTLRHRFFRLNISLLRNNKRTPRFHGRRRRFRCIRVENEFQLDLHFTVGTCFDRRRQRIQIVET
uniref:Uncharacterized protein n=1 Tax=Romanomermis culicivorax TaxID=13658 RepID=A0A915I033_ROMCU